MIRVAHIHGVSASLNATDKAVHTVSDQVPGVVWLSPCSGVNVFMPDDSEHAAVYLAGLAREVAALREYYANVNQDKQL